MAVISFKCPNCDGELIFDPTTQAYKCEYCGSGFSQEELDAMKPAETQEQVIKQENDFAEQTEQEVAEEKKKETEAVFYSCPSCGAEIVTEATTAATFCYYCHNPIVLSKKLEGNYLPDKVIPFRIPRKEAEARFLEYVKTKKFVPKAFFNKSQIESLSGVYFPYWVYDVDFSGNICADAKSIRTWVSGHEEFTETRQYMVERMGDLELRNLTENALQKANAKLASGVMPYKFSDMKDFTMGYLSGFLAERRDIEQVAVAGKMQNEMKQQAEKMMKDTIKGYHSVSVRTSDFRVKTEKWSYVLLPVWTVTYKGSNGKIYYYSMNGQTGNVCGELPIDKKKVALVSLVAGLAVFVAALIGGFFI
ncbi:MAG: TFIIB-type zinc ribbon-containing protein [Roseburia sp.]